MINVPYENLHVRYFQPLEGTDATYSRATCLYIFFFFVIMHFLAGATYTPDQLE